LQQIQDIEDEYFFVRSPRVAATAFCRRCLGAGSGFPLQSFAAETATPIGAAVSRKSISASIPSAAKRKYNKQRSCDNH
jgi:hypothetical protein